MMSEQEKKFVGDLYLRVVKKANKFQTLQEFRWELMKEMLDCFPALRMKARKYLNIFNSGKTIKDKVEGVRHG